MKKEIYVSLKWRIAVLIGGVFLFLHSVFSYTMYLEADDEFIRNRENSQVRYSNIAREITKDSFLVLGQFAELFSVIKTSSQGDDFSNVKIASTLDKNWQQWQFIWGLESAVFYNQQAKPVKQWGHRLGVNESTIEQVLNTEQPNYQIICTDACSQWVFIPMMANSELIGVFGVSRSFADPVIKFNRATGLDIGVFVVAPSNKKSKWPYKLSAITHAEINKAIVAFVTKGFVFDDFFEQRKVVDYKGESFELTVFPVSSGIEASPPFFIIIDNVTRELKVASKRLQSIWFNGVVSLVLSLLLMLVVLFFSLRRITRLSMALPLLAEKKYDDFRQVLNCPRHPALGKDEIDLLNHTAVVLSGELEALEQEIRNNTCQLIEQGYELSNERDFIRQLIDVAPISIITQDTNGMILSINQAGIDHFAMEEAAIIGSVFDNFIPDVESKHLSSLKQLRSGMELQHFKADGKLSVELMPDRHISWLHSVVKPNTCNSSPVILSLGVDITERKQIEEQMLKMAMIDHLTGMRNRRSFQIELAREIAAAKRYGDEIALFYLDLDQFKIINDTSGHDAGDGLLRLVSSALGEAVRGTDILSRIGGDEFTLIMPKPEKLGIENVAKKIIESLMALEYRVENKVYKISASIGVAIFPQHGLDEHELLSNADLAMYQAKESGRGKYHIFSAEYDYQSRLTRRLYWKDIIEEALKNERFILLFQPILDIQADRISHYECLSRIENDDGSYLMPGEFIPFAEELGLIGQIDRMVVKKAVEQHIKFKKQGKDIKLAVNLSGRSFNDTTIFEDIANLLSLPGVDTQQIIFEITETAAVSNFTSAQSLIRKIKDLGCALALDDFGVGFSSFYYLKHLPVDYVKIDGSFIKQLDSNFEDKVFVKALTDVSQSLGKKTVAEFVENEVILDVLKEFGIDYAQGYHIGKPAPLE